MRLGTSGLQHPWSDAWLLLAAGMPLDGAEVPLAGLLQRADGIQHAVATFDEVDGGLARLQAAGLLTVHAGAVSLTAAGVALVREAATDRGSLHQWQDAIVGALGAKPWSAVHTPAQSRRDPALPPALTPAEYEAALRTIGYTSS